MAKEKIIQNAVKHPGRLRAAAKRAGESINEYASEHKHDPRGTIGDAARLYEGVIKPAIASNKKKGSGHWSGK